MDKKKEISYDEAVALPYNYCFSKTESFLISKVLYEIKEMFNARLVRICNDDTIGRIAICFQKNLKVQLIDYDNLSSSAKVSFENDTLVVKTKKEQKKMKLDLSGLKHGFIKKQETIENFSSKTVPLSKQLSLSFSKKSSYDFKRREEPNESFEQPSQNYYRDDWWLYDTPFSEDSSELY